MSIGKRIKAQREKLNISQQELANCIKKSQATVAQIENDKNKGNFEMLEVICGTLNVSADWILFGKEKIELKDEDRDFLEKYNTLTEREKGEIDRVIKEIEEKRVNKIASEPCNKVGNL